MPETLTSPPDADFVAPDESKRVKDPNLAEYIARDPDVDRFRTIEAINRHALKKAGELKTAEKISARAHSGLAPDIATRASEAGEDADRNEEITALEFELEAELKTKSNEELLDLRNWIQFGEGKYLGALMRGIRPDVSDEEISEAEKRQDATYRILVKVINRRNDIGHNPGGVEKK